MLDKLLIIENIKTLAKFKKIPLKEVEKTIGGVSEGYFARLSSDIKSVREGRVQEGQKERPLPPVEVLEKIATGLGVSIDLLLNMNFTDKGDPEIAIVSFLDMLKVRTERNSFVWQEEPTSVTFGDGPYGKFEHHPLVETRIRDESDFYSDPSETEYKAFHSLFLDADVDLNDGIYTLFIGMRKLMICEICYRYNNFPTYQVELYSVSNDSIQKIANGTRTTNNETCIDKAIYALFNAVRKNRQLNPSGEDVLKVLENFVNYLESMEKDDKEEK